MWRSQFDSAQAQKIGELEQRLVQLEKMADAQAQLLAQE